MTPRLYEEISSKLAETWGEYAGWAHTVRSQPSAHSWAYGKSRYYLLLI